MIKCLALACLFPFLFTICGPRQDPNLNKDKRGQAIKLVQDSQGRDKTHKTVDFATEDIIMLRASGTKVIEYGWGAELITGSKDEYTVKFSYQGNEGIKEALWSANVATKEVKAKNTLAHKYTW